MVAVLFVTQSAVSAWIWAALLVAAVGLTPIASWFVQAWKHQTGRRLILAVFFAFILARGTYAVICPSCAGCDPWWLEWFWVCFPNP
jgi:MFS family permease